MPERESAIEKYLIGAIAVLDGLCLKFAVPGIRGYMDRLCLLPGGIVFFVEVKRPKGGVLAELQKVRREEMRAIGARCYVVKCREEIDDVIAVETDLRDKRPAQRRASGGTQSLVA